MIGTGLVQYKEYVLYSTKARLVSETINNHLGIAWLVLDPVLRMVVYYVVFVCFMGTRTTDFISFLLIGVVVTSWFTQTINKSCRSIGAAGGLLKQLHIPKQIFPTITGLVQTVEFLLVLAILLGWFAVAGKADLHWLSIPALILAQISLNYGLSLVAAAVIPFVPDLQIMVSYVLTVAFFMSGVFFEITPENPRYEIFMLNPLAKLLEQYRAVILHAQWPDWHSLLMIAGLGFVLIMAMSLIIHRLDKYYPRFV